ncbi:alpha/beta fold hydrolase [Dechloromonas denitrificans]|uniref:alpha/beta fold hydrolase n=1 Tax=Dechloromonas denitrificans TaxID=281362 RepID=UPI001CF8EF13|nr:alpha/beta fold hydrolase [Dechloromonas denitrificans]UCV02129.1 alpha/beta hydrolase [Dechloromonas denitrificans]
MEKTIRTTDGLSLWSEAFGQPGDRPILLIMGAMNQGIFWPDAFCRRLASLGYYVIRYDHRDTGQSSTVDFQTQPYRLAELTQDALAVLHGHQLPKATVVGLSMGGYIAQLLAIEHPEAVDRLVLISSSADQRPYMAATMGQPTVGFALPGPGAALLDYIRATLAQPPGSAPAIEQNVLTGWALTYGGSREFPRTQLTAALRRAAGRTSNPLAAFHHALAVAASPDRLEGIKSIAAPTLVIHGRADNLLPLAHGEYLARHIPGARLQLFDMGHSFMWSWDDEVLASLTAFLADDSIAPPFQTNHD